MPVLTTEIDYRIRNSQIIRENDALYALNILQSWETQFYISNVYTSEYSAFENCWFTK